MCSVTELQRSDGRIVFGRDPALYDRARPGYPERVFELLRDRCGLREGSAVLEIGPGPGTATRRLLALGADPVVAVEPNPALAAYLDEATSGAVALVVAPFEEAELPDSSFDLATAASSFHWVEPEAGLSKVRRLLRSGGWWAMWWNMHGDQTAADPFHQATTVLLGPHVASRWSALDADARFADLAAAGFVELEHEVVRWTATFDTAGTRDLYATFSPIARLPETEREVLLDAIADVAATQFGGSVARPMRTPIYTARSPAR
jgi:SAM-dependent methyltransferase